MFQKLPPVITGTLYLTITGMITRLFGFFYKMWLGNLIGAEEMGIYQLVFPVFSICLAICGGPFQTAVSKFTAEYQESNPSKAKCYFQISLVLSLTLSGICAVFTLLFHQTIATYFLLNRRCAVLLPYIALSIPLSALHNCITGWYYGQKKTAVPAISNLAEQGIRILFVFFLVQTRENFTVLHVVWALAAGELISACITLTIYVLEERKHPNKPAVFQKEYLFQTIKLIWPLSVNRLTMNLLQSVEAIMIPSRLILYGLSERSALSMYGALTGMALGFILFPTALTGSFSLMLIPDIAQAYAKQKRSYIRKASKLSLAATFLMGCFFTAVFFLFGDLIGNICYPGTLAGPYIRSLSWLCPFLYLNHILTSILHGMSMTAQTFKTQMCGLILRLCVTVFLIPKYGMECYFLALLASQLLMCALNFHALYNCNIEPL